MNNQRRIAQSAIACLALSAAICANAQVDFQTQRRAREEAAFQQQRERLQQQTEERERLFGEADGRMPDSTVEADKDEDLPKEAECFNVTQLELELPDDLTSTQRRLGASALPQDPFYFLRQAMETYQGRCFGYQGANLIRKRLARLILSRNYSTTRLGIPHQDMSQGRLVFVLIPGVIRSISFHESDIYGSWKTAFPARPGDLLNVRELEQGQEQLRRMLSRDVDLQLVPGPFPGESDIVIHLIRRKPWRLAVSLDDSGAKGTGRLQAGVNLAVDNPLGLNDQFSIGFNTDANRKGREGGTTGNSASYAIPYGYWTFGLATGSYSYHQQIAGLNQTFVSSGMGQSLEFKISKVFQRDQNQKNSVQFKVGKRWNRAYIDDTEIDVQRRNATYAELAWVHKHYIGAAQFDVMLAGRWGTSWFGADEDFPGRQSDAPTTRYSLQTIDATLHVPFRIAQQPLTYIGTLRGQNTQSSLYASEQFSIGNRYTVRGFDGELSLSAERGFFLRNELDLPSDDSRRSLYAGLDVGKVYGPTVQHLLGSKLAGAAVGVRGAMKGFSYDLFLGWALYKPQHFRTSSPAAGFNLVYQY